MFLRIVFKSITIAIFAILIIQCSGSKKALEITNEEQEVFNSAELDTVAIQNDSLQFDIIIMEIGFSPWLQSMAQPKGYYTQTFMENRNRIYVTNWNQRVLDPFKYDPNLYELQINYYPNIDYGYDVNYKLYNYFIYFQRKYNQRLGPFVPRIK